MSDKLKPRDSTMEKSKLLRCPFCGGEAEIKDNGYVFWAECQKCGATGSQGAIYERACEHWNRRKTMRITLPSNLDAKAKMVENPHEREWTFKERPVTHLLITEQNIILGSDNGKDFGVMFGLEIDGEIFNPVRDAEEILLYISGRMLEMRGRMGQETSG